MTNAEGIGARQAALRMLDGVLRRGQTLDAAAAGERKLAPADHGLAIAIAGEALRRIPDLDELIDSATRQRLPDDSKARTVLRLALAQKIGLGTPDHAVVATALPLVDGGPRRLVHGVLGTLLRRGLTPIDAPRLPPEVEARWSAVWGDEVVSAARRQVAARPALDLTFADDTEAIHHREPFGAVLNLRREAPEQAYLPLIRQSGAGQQIDQHFGRGLIESQGGDMFARLNAELPQAQRP